MVKTGVIIAAGAGTRLADKTNVPKPLKKLLGVPLLKRIVYSSYKAGLERIVVVVGFQKEKIISYIEKEKWPIKVEWVENTDWKKSNGVSVLAAKDAVKENFILMMSDHIFDPNTMRALSEVDLAGEQAKLAVDYKVHQIFDEDDATKVEVLDGKIKSIDKALVKFNAIDTGMFLFTPAIFEALESVKTNDDCSLSDGVRQLAESGKMGTFDIGEAYWQDVDTPPALKHAEKILLNACRKPTDGIVSKNFNRHVSLFFSSFLVWTPLTPNQLTIIFLMIGLLSGYLATFGTYWTYLAAAILFKFTSILDGVDGEISKLKYKDSKFGQWLDTIGDNLTYVAFTFGTIYAVYRGGFPYPEFFAGFATSGLFCLLFVMFFYIIKFSDSGSLLAVQDDFKKSENVPFYLRALVKLYFVIKRDFFSVVFLVLAIFYKPHWIAFLIGFATHIAWIVIVVSKIKSLRKAKS